MRVTIIGGGNIGTLMAAEATKNGHQVSVYTSKVEKWKAYNRKVTVLTADGTALYTAQIDSVTSDLSQAVKDSQVILVTYPASMFKALSDDLGALLPNNGQVMLGFLPGSGGVEFNFAGLADRGITVFGTQRVHSIARLGENGLSVYELGKKDQLYAGSIPSNRIDSVVSVLESVLGMKTAPLPNYLSVTLTPSNPILHTTRLYSLFYGCENNVFPDNPLFYESWDDDSSRILFSCDSELQRLCDVIPMDLKSVVSLPVYYESNTPESLTDKIRSIKAFKEIRSPMKKVDEGWVVDWSSRYFSSDFPYGLRIIAELGKLFRVQQPNIDKVYSWHESIVGRYAPMDIPSTIEGFLSLYH